MSKQDGWSEKHDSAWLYNDRAVTERRYKRELLYDPDTRMLFLDSMGKLTNSNMLQGKMSFTCDLSGCPIRRTTRIFMEHVVGVISTPNVLAPSTGSVISLKLDGVNIPTQTLDPMLIDIQDYANFITQMLIDNGAAGATNSVDPLARRIYITTPGHTWAFQNIYPKLNPFANFPTLSLATNAILNVQLFRTRYINLQLLLGSTKLLSSSSANSGILASTTATFHIKDPSQPQYIDSTFESKPNYAVDFNEAINQITVNVLDEFGNIPDVSPTDWIFVTMHLED